jgi:hypothetical protein
MDKQQGMLNSLMFVAIDAERLSRKMALLKLMTTW